MHKLLSNTSRKCRKTLWSILTRNEIFIQFAYIFQKYFKLVKIYIFYVFSQYEMLFLRNFVKIDKSVAIDE